MANDYENGTKKTIDLTIEAEKISSDILKEALQEFMAGKAEKKGRISYRQLEKKSDSKLDSIEVSEDNIGDFLKTARKYDVDFALKADKSTQPATYHVFFSASKTENFKKAFTEYVGKNAKTNQRGVFTREQLKREAARVAQSPHRKHRSKERKRETHRGSNIPIPLTPRARSDDAFTANFYADNMRKALSAECRSIPES